MCVVVCKYFRHMATCIHMWFIYSVCCVYVYPSYGFMHIFATHFIILRPRLWAVCAAQHTHVHLCVGGSHAGVSAKALSACACVQCACACICKHSLSKSACSPRTWHSPRRSAARLNKYLTASRGNESKTLRKKKPRSPERRTPCAACPDSERTLLAGLLPLGPLDLVLFKQPWTPGAKRPSREAASPHLEGSRRCALAASRIPS